jgi:hypothetical protein
LVDVIDAEGTLVYTDVVVRESLLSDFVTYEFSNNILTQAENLKVLHHRDSSQFAAAVAQARSGLSSVQIKGMDEMPVFSRIARNGALRLEFSEHLDPLSVNRQTLQVMSGNPATKSNEVRYIVRDEYDAHGEPLGVVVVDSTISSRESAALGLPINGVGYPASADQQAPSMCLRIPTRIDFLFGQNEVLRSKKGLRQIRVRVNSAGVPAEPAEYSTGNSSGKPDVIVRAFRSGNLLDPNNGYLLDLTRPTLITELGVDLIKVLDNPDPTASSRSFLLTYSIQADGCNGIAPKEGDVLVLGDTVFQFAAAISSNDPAAYEVIATLLSGASFEGDYTGAPLFAELTASYASENYSLQMCWVKFLPEPAALPATGVDPMATLTIHFDEAIGAETVRALDTFVFASYALGSSGAEGPYQSGAESVGDYIDSLIGYGTYPLSATGSGRIRFGPISPSQDARSFTIAPVAGISDAHAEATNLRMCVALRDGSEGIRDLAGNPIAMSGFVAGNDDQVEILTLQGAPSSWPSSRYFALRFTSLDENRDGHVEYSGQYTLPRTGYMSGRELRQFSRMADASNTYIGQRLKFGQGIMTPLTPAGAVLMTELSYHHLGFGLLAPDSYNLDIVGLNWAPFGGSVYDATFDRYSLALSHAERFPDDYINPSNGYPKYYKSGLKYQGTFDNNILGRNEGIEEKIVFDTKYYISAMNMFVAASGTQMMPWPDFTQFYTWRDTSIPQTILGGNTAGQDKRGAPPEVTGQDEIFAPGEIPSIGLPLLMRFRSYPMGGFHGQNGFQIQIMVGSSALPAFRVFSSGGLNASDEWKLVVPDVGDDGTKPTGGYNTATGAKTKKFGPELYWAQVDFSVRVSRVYTHWFTFGGQVDDISSLTVEEVSNPGTEMVLDFRGAELVDITNCEVNAFNSVIDLDAYGDFQGACGSISNPSEWSTDLALLESLGSTAFQIRLTFVSSLETELEPELDALGLAWTVR